MNRYGPLFVFMGGPVDLRPAQHPGDRIILTPHQRVVQSPASPAVRNQGVRTRQDQVFGNLGIIAMGGQNQGRDLVRVLPADPRPGAVAISSRPNSTA